MQQSGVSLCSPIQNDCLFDVIPDRQKITFKADGLEGSRD